MKRYLSMLGVLLLAVAAIGAVGTVYETDPVEIDNGGEPANSTNYTGYASIGGTVIEPAASTNYITDGSFFPMVETGTITVPQLSLNLGPQSPANVTEGTSAAGIPVMQLTLTAGSIGNVTVAGITFTASGTGDDQNHISNVTLYQDVDGDGQYNGSVDVQIAQSGTGFSADDGIVAFTFTRVITMSTSEQWLVTYDFSGAATGNETFQCNVALDADVTATDGVDPVGVTGAPIQGATITIAAPGTPGSLSVLSGVNTLPSGNLFFRDETNVAVLQFRLRASSIESITVQSLTFTASGTGDDRTGISEVRLYVDVNGDGLQDGGDLPVSTAEAFAGDNGQITFASINRSIAVSSQEIYIVVMDLADTAVEGDTFGVSLAQAAAVQGQGDTSASAVSVSGTPVGAMIEISTVTIPPIVTTTTTGGGGCHGGSGSEPWAWLAPFVLLAGVVLALRRRRSIPA